MMFNLFLSVCLYAWLEVWLNSLALSRLVKAAFFSFIKLIYGSIHENATLVQIKRMFVLQGSTGSPGEQGPKGEKGPQVCGPVPGLSAECLALGFRHLPPPHHSSPAMC